jgi:hypothetical protein
VNKAGTQLLVSPHIKTRAQALAVVRDEAVAEIYRVALEGGGLQALERAHAEELDWLRSIFEGMGIDYPRAVNAMLANVPRIRYADLWTADGRPRVRFPGRLDV